MLKPLAALCLAAAPAAAQSVTTYHNAISRAGAYIVPGLTQAAAPRLHRDTSFNGTVTGNIYAQPLYWKPTAASPGRIIVATESNHVEALDATSGAKIWQTQLPAPAPLAALGCGNINPEGITGTPAIDPSGSGTIYLDAVTDTPPDGVRHKIYALSATTGKILPNWPLDIQAALLARGIPFDSTIQGQRSAALFLNGQLYISYGGRSGDCGDYHGTVVQIKTTTQSLAAIWATRAARGGIWAQGGAASDGTSLFVTTGNTSGATSWGDGEAIIRLAPGLAHSTAPADFFTPANWQILDDDDADLGGTEALPITVPLTPASPSTPGAPRLLAFGKDGNAYLVNRASLGGIGGALAISQIANGPIITAPAVYSTPATTMVALRNPSGLHCPGSSLSMLTITASPTKPVTETWCAGLNGAGAPIITTTDGTANPIVWIAGAEGDNQLHGFNALTGKPLVTGTAPAETMAGLRHFVTILAANSRLYIAATNKIYAFTFTPAP
jgi:outer membrane protein assembly factor BamB